MKDSIILGSIKNPPKNRYEKLKQHLGKAASSTELILQPMNASTLHKVCEAISEVREIDKSSKIVKEDVISTLPNLINIIALALDIPSNEQMRVRASIANQWTQEQVAEAVKVIYSQIDFDSALELLLIFGKVKSVGE